MSGTVRDVTAPVPEQSNLFPRPPEPSVPDSSFMHGERMSVPERLIVAPAPGVFASPIGGPRLEGEHLVAGDAIGVVELSGEATPVCSSFSGALVGILAEEGQMLRAGQPVAWLRVA